MDRISLIAIVLGAVAVASSVSADSKRPAPTAPPPATKVAPKVKDVEAGPLYDQAEADKTCPGVCKPPTTWTGAWRTTKAGIASVCACAEPPAPAPPAPPPPPPPSTATRDIEAGPLLDQAAAAKACPQVCTPPSTWSGAWHTTKPGAMSVCTCNQPSVKAIETSPIKSSADARANCSAACAPPLRWSGEWKEHSRRRTTCDCYEASREHDGPDRTAR